MPGAHPRARLSAEFAAIEAGVPSLVEAREIIAEFQLMIRRRAEAGLIPWIERARASLVASFARGVTSDEAAVRAAITSPWSNRQTEGQITRLKLVRWQMYGWGCVRAKFERRLTLLGL
jgi:transposase